MASGQFGAGLRDLGRIFGSGTASGLRDSELLERFADDRDEAAFAALVARHGPMVLATCRGVLRSSQDAEDAFQATFLILARKAVSIRADGSLGGWLHRTARRVAVQASVDLSKRRRRERASGAPEPRRPGPWDDLILLLHEEIGRLPEKYRVPIVLCDLGAMTREEAAGQLGWPPGTVAGRLARGRKLLHDRLTRRGAAPASTLLAAIPRATVPESWAETAIVAAIGKPGKVAAGTSPASTTAVLWCERTLRIMFLTKLKSVGSVALATCFAAGLLTAFLRANGQAPGPNPPAPAASRSSKPEAVPIEEPSQGVPGESVVVRGRVLDPDGRPVSGATLRLENLINMTMADPDEPKGTSGPDGRFAFRAPREVFDRFGSGYRMRSLKVIASAPGFGFGWGEPGIRSDALGDITARLARDDHPLEGRLLDLEGRPIPGASIRTLYAGVSPGGDLSSWAIGFRDRDEGIYSKLEQFPLALPPVVTGPDGRFRLDGVGRDRMVMFLVSGPTIETTFAFARTQDGPAIRGRNLNVIGPDTFICHGAKFDHAAAPCKPILGVVRDRDTGRPLAGVKLGGMVYRENDRAFNPYITGTTDDLGRYRLAGLTRGDRYRLFVTPGEGQPYPTASFTEPAGTPGLDPSTIDFSLKRGILVRGRLVEKGTGRPVKGSVSYFAFLDNSHAADFPGFKEAVYEPRVWAKPDGRFEVAALPGEGFLAARAELDAGYREAVGVESIRGMNPRQPFSALPGFVSPNNYHTLAGVNLEAGVEVATRDIELDPGRSLPGSVVDPDGRPISGCVVQGLADRVFLLPRPLDTPHFEATGLDPSKPRRIYAFHDGRKLAGSLLVRGDEPGPLVVALQPRGTIVGRVVDDEGRPLTKIQMMDLRESEFKPDRGLLFAEINVDADGRFEVPVVPGLSYRAYADERTGSLLGKFFEGVKVAPGQSLDLGDLKLKPTQ